MRGPLLPAAVACLLACLCAALPEEALHPEALELSYCLREAHLREAEQEDGVRRLRPFDVSKASCGEVLEFLLQSRMHLSLSLEDFIANNMTTLMLADAPMAAPVGSMPRPDPLATWLLSRTAAMLSAHIHLNAAVVNRRSACFDPNVRVALALALSKQKKLLEQQLEASWAAAAGEEADRFRFLVLQLASAVSHAVAADIRTMQDLLRREWRGTPSPALTQPFAVDANGALMPIEALRRQTFDLWRTDKGLLRGMLRHLLLPLTHHTALPSLADFGAATGESVSFLRETGLAAAFGFDGTRDIEALSNGLVRRLDLAQPADAIEAALQAMAEAAGLPPQFDWAAAIDTAAHLPESRATGIGAAAAEPMVRAMARRARRGIVMSWGAAEGGVGQQAPENWTALVELWSGMAVNKELTALMRSAATQPHLQESVTVFTTQ